MASGFRAALYYAPAIDDPLWRAGADWLGRDPETNTTRTQSDLDGIAAVTADPRVYGFHATLKPPMKLRDGANWDGLLEAVADLARATAPFVLPRLAVADLHGFLALRETTPSPELQALSDLCVAGVDHLRALPSDAELARRRGKGLSPAHDAMLVRWGYPYVFTTWFFHMTLTRRLAPDEHARYRPAAETFFAAALDQPRVVDDIAIFVQAEAGAAFTLAERIALRG